MGFFGITLPQFSITAFLVVLATAVTSLWWHRSLQKKQIKFEKSKMFAKEKKKLFSDFLCFQKKIKKATKGLFDKEKEIAEGQLSEMLDEQFSKAPDDLISEMVKLVDRITTNIKIYGDVDLIDTWNKYTKEISPFMTSKVEAINYQTIVRAEERLARAFRKNMGHDDSKLRAGSITATQILELVQDPHDVAPVQNAIFDICKDEKYEWLNND